MHEVLSMIYSAYLLTHRQECKSRNGFINLSAYMDTRFIQNLNKSIKRKSNAISWFKFIKFNDTGNELNNYNDIKL